MTDQAQIDTRLREAGAAPRSVVLGPEPTPAAPTPPEGPWIVMPYGAQTVVGAVGRGKFAPYAALWTDVEAIDLAVTLATTAPQSVAADEEDMVEAGARTSAAILERTARRGGAAAPNELQIGDILDAFGPDTGHHLYAARTPFPARSQPPSDAAAARRTYRVEAPLPDTVHEGRAAPWFEQPGGGAMVVLDRPIRWYVDQGLLVELSGDSRDTDHPSDE